MFYPVESLKKGGRFYMCWVADSWPLRFATITHRQLWSQDVRKLCDDLLEVMTNESGRPVNRFSLRLSSQLMRGLVRLYQKKVNVFLSDLSMINANVTKHINQKYNIRGEVQHRTPRLRPQVTEQQTEQTTLPLVLLEEPENEQPIEVLIQNSGNIVANIQEITLKEATIPEFQLPPNDDFGEENPEQAILLVADRTMEMMMAAIDPSSRVSGIDPGLDLTDKSQVAKLAHSFTHERLDEHDITMFKSRIDEIAPGGGFEKDILIPEISDIPIPEIPIPLQEPVPLEPEMAEAREEPVIPTVPVPDDIELEELEEPQAKRRKLRKLIIDRKTKLDSNYLRTRIDNPNVELRCEDSFQDIVDISVPAAVFLQRPSHAGLRLPSRLGSEVTRLFERNLGVVLRSPTAEREFQNVQEDIMKRSRRRTRSGLNLSRIDEVPETVADRAQTQDIPHEAANITLAETTLPQRTLPETSLPQISVPEITLPEICGPDVTVTAPQVVVPEEDMADMLTQKIATLSPETMKRKSDHGGVLTPKMQRVENASFRDSQLRRRTAGDSSQALGEPENELHPITDKENIPVNMQDTEIRETTGRPSKDVERSVTVMLQHAGLADILSPQQPAPGAGVSLRQSARPRPSHGSETPLGSLDRTKVSLGESEQTTDSRRFIRDEWGTEGTMLKVISFVRAESRPITVRALVSKGPVILGYKRIIAARCFTSLLKLKQHGFVTINKCPDTLEIKDIRLGRQFD